MENNYLCSKPRYEILDGLRGVAALMVILFHCMETYSWKTNVQIIDHGYLAVDFFFILSGFVVGYAYDDRWRMPSGVWGKKGNLAVNLRGMSIWAFIKRRLVRLHPMVIMGTVIGGCAFFFRQCDMFPVVECDLSTYLLALALCLIMIPCPPSIGNQLHAWDEFNPFNGPNWSLSYEYVANIFYALILRRLPNVMVGILCAVGAFLTLDLTLGWDVFGFFPEGAQYTVIGGWNFSAKHAYIGFTRLSYPFICGYLISRMAGNESSFLGKRLRGGKVNGGFWWCSLILIIVFSIPQISNGQRGIADGLYQAICILMVFPLVIILGAGSRLTGKGGASVCKWLGDISFPLYITHYPLMYCQMAWVTTHYEAPMWQHVVVNIGVVLISIGIGWACFKLYDEPVRKWLTDHWLKK